MSPRLLVQIGRNIGTGCKVWLTVLFLSALLAVAAFPALTSASGGTDRLQSAMQQEDGVWYTVQPGDYLASIAARFGVTVQAIIQANDITNPDLIQVGQQLWIPDAEAPDAPPGEQTPEPTPEPTDAPPDSEDGFYYTVQPGDSLSEIAARFGVTVSAIIQANNIANPNLIQVGQQLWIPGSEEAPPPPTVTPTSPAATATPTSPPATDEPTATPTSPSATATPTSPPPTATPTSPPPTATPTTPPATDEPTATPQPDTSLMFNIAVVGSCEPNAGVTYVQGRTYVNGQPRSGYNVAFSYAADGPIVAQVQSGPHAGYLDWDTGYYSHILQANGPREGDWYFWVVDDNSNRISEIAHVHTDGTAGPGTCQQAVVDFDSR